MLFHHALFLPLTQAEIGKSPTRLLQTRSPRARSRPAGYPPSAPPPRRRYFDGDESVIEDDFLNQVGTFDLFLAKGDLKLLSFDMVTLGNDRSHRDGGIIP